MDVVGGVHTGDLRHAVSSNNSGAKISFPVGYYTGFPLGLEKWEGIFQAGKSPEILNRLEKSGKITQKAGKIREFLVIFKLTVYYLLKNTGKVGEFCRSRKVILILLLITQFWHLKITESH